MQYEDLLYDVTDGVAAITINRPETRNALRVRTFEELTAAIRRADVDAAVGVITLTGAGDKAFSSGGDLHMARELTTAHRAREHFVHRMMGLSREIVYSDKPVVCVVNGVCVGGGAEIMTFCDFVIAADDALIWFLGTAIGGFCWWGPAQLLPLQAGLRRAEEILYTSRKLSGREAAELGIATESVPRADLAGAVDATCKRILGVSPEGVRLTKASLRATKEILLATMSLSAESAVAAHESSDVLASFDAFLHGEEMDWRARRAAAAQPRTSGRSD